MINLNNIDELIKFTRLSDKEKEDFLKRNKIIYQGYLYYWCKKRKVMLKCKILERI